MRLFESDTLVVASHNPGKVREITDLLVGRVAKIVSATDARLIEPEETEDTFIGNAILKARAAATVSGHVALSDDSGLCITALDGAPGIYSARWAGPNKNFTDAMMRVLRELDGTQTADRSAWFTCALALAWPDGHVEAFEGRVTGCIAPEMRGARGFGYDPVFIPDGHTITFGEMDPDRKHAMSHRADAFTQLVNGCFRP